jgi:hypothetical protein
MRPFGKRVDYLEHEGDGGIGSERVPRRAKTPTGEGVKEGEGGYLVVQKHRRERG